MEMYVMQHPETGEKRTCYWHESVTLSKEGWNEIEYIPCPYILDDY